VAGRSSIFRSVVNRECPVWCQWADEKLPPDEHPENFHRSAMFVVGINASPPIDDDDGVSAAVWTCLQEAPPGTHLSVGVWLGFGFDEANGFVLDPAEARKVAERLRDLAGQADLYGGG
jgi:hypothetical protein